jgi:hypothetical protein
MRFQAGKNAVFSRKQQGPFLEAFRGASNSFANKLNYARLGPGFLDCESTAIRNQENRTFDPRMVYAAFVLKSIRLKLKAVQRGAPMSRITFYRQTREDGDVRTGLSADDMVLFDRYEGRSKRNPALRWFVDVRCEGKLPTDAEKARAWLLDHAPEIKAGLDEFGETLHAGLDIDSWPVLHPMKRAPKGTRITFACSAVRSTDARSISAIIKKIADNFEAYVKRLQLLEAVGH